MTEALGQDFNVLYESMSFRISHILRLLVVCKDYLPYEYHTTVHTARSSLRTAHQVPQTGNVSRFLKYWGNDVSKFAKAREAPSYPRVYESIVGPRTRPEIPKHNTPCVNLSQPS
jgi:hypothetical protein